MQLTSRPRRNKDRQLADDAAAIARATAFRVIVFEGRGRYREVGVFDSLDAARAAQAAAGRDAWGRGAMIYALGLPGRPALFVG